jgi:hypothetical protein
VSPNFVLAKKWKKWANLFTFILKLIFKSSPNLGKKLSLIFPFKDIESIASSHNLRILKKFLLLMHLYFRVGGRKFFKTLLNYFDPCVGTATTSAVQKDFQVKLHFRFCMEL